MKKICISVLCAIVMAACTQPVSSPKSTETALESKEGCNTAAKGEQAEVKPYASFTTNNVLPNLFNNANSPKGCCNVAIQPTRFWTVPDCDKPQNDDDQNMANADSKQSSNLKQNP